LIIFSLLLLVVANPVEGFCNRDAKGFSLEASDAALQKFLDGHQMTPP
jgi:hypothetical protein